MSGLPGRCVALESLMVGLFARLWKVHTERLLDRCGHVLLGAEFIMNSSSRGLLNSKSSETTVWERDGLVYGMGKESTSFLGWSPGTELMRHFLSGSF